VFKRRRQERRAQKLARVLLTLDAAAGERRSAPPRRSRAFLAA
jgi:hypothetical protein